MIDGDTHMTDMTFPLSFDFDISWENEPDFLSFLSTLIKTYPDTKILSYTSTGPGGGNPNINITLPTLDSFNTFIDFYDPDMTIDDISIHIIK